MFGEDQKVTCPVCLGQKTEGDPCFDCNDTGKITLSDFIDKTLQSVSLTLAKKVVGVRESLTNLVSTQTEGEDKMPSWEELGRQHGMTVDQFTRHCINGESERIEAELKTVSSEVKMALMSVAATASYNALRLQFDPTYVPEAENASTDPARPSKKKPKKGLEKGADPKVPF